MTEKFIAILIFSVNLKTCLGSVNCYYYPNYPSLSRFYPTLCSGFCCSGYWTTSSTACCYNSTRNSESDSESESTSIFATPWFIAVVIVVFVILAVIGSVVGWLQKKKRQLLHPVMPMPMHVPVMTHPASMYPPQMGYGQYPPMARYPPLGYPQPPPPYSNPLPAFTKTTDLDTKLKYEPAAATETKN